MEGWKPQCGGLGWGQLYYVTSAVSEGCVRWTAGVEGTQRWLFAHPPLLSPSPSSCFTLIKFLSSSPCCSPPPQDSGMGGALWNSLLSGQEAQEARNRGPRRQESRGTLGRMESTGSLGRQESRGSLGRQQSQGNFVGQDSRGSLARQESRGTLPRVGRQNSRAGLTGDR